MLEMMKFGVGDPCLLLLTSTGLYGGYICWKMGNDHEILRNLKNGICNVILLNVARFLILCQAWHEHKPKGGDK
jgi:hypothetical protein